MDHIWIISGSYLDHIWIISGVCSKGVPYIFIMSGKGSEGEPDTLTRSG